MEEQQREDEAMGMSADAIIAWGVDFGQPDLTGEGFDFEENGLPTYDLEKGFADLFGFTEEAPEPPPAGCTANERAAWFKTVREPYNNRLDAAVPVAFKHYGYEYSGTALVLKRSLAEVEWGCDTVDASTLAPPSPGEVEAIRKVLSNWSIQWPLAVRLLLMASYG